MNFSGIFHSSSDAMCYALNNDELKISIKTGYDIDRVVLYYGDPYSAGIMGGSQHWEGTPAAMTDFLPLAHHKLWQITVKPEFKRCKYYFALYCGNEEYFMFEDGFKSGEELKKYNGRLQYFFYPWMNSADICTTPSWVNDTVWYQIFPDRFCMGSSDKKSKHLLPWNADKTVKTYHGIYGGDIAGITQKLPYLNDLGITGLYLTPINQSTSNHKYNTDDYCQIDRSFGTSEQVKQMVSAAHSMGIKVMFDGVFNHCGYHFAPWQDVVKNGERSKYFNWFMINKWPFNKIPNNAKKGNYYAFAFQDGMPKLNTNNQEVIDYFVDVCSYWVTEYDIDALRLDVANEVSHSFCKQLNKKMKNLKSDFYILGEIWHNSIQWLRGDEFDSVMNYVLQSCINDFWDIKDRTSVDLEQALNQCYTMYMEQTNNVLFNLLDSHDTIRLINKLKGDENKFYQQMAMLFTMPGSTCIYYGTEIILPGGYDPDNRRPMPWKEIEAGVYDEKIDKIKALISLRKNYAAARSGNYSFTHSSKQPRVIIYAKECNREILQVVLNCSQTDYTVNISQEQILFSNLYNDGTVKPNGTVIYKVK